MFYLWVSHKQKQAMKSLFHIGQKIICIDSKPNFGVASGLIEGKAYNVQSILICTCGIAAISVGIVEDVFTGMFCTCGKHYKSTGFRMYSQRRFVPADFDKYADDEIKEALNQGLLIPHE